MNLREHNVLIPLEVDIGTLTIKSLKIELKDVTAYSKKEALNELRKMGVSEDYLNSIFLSITVYDKVKYIKYPNSETLIACLLKNEFLKSGEKEYGAWLQKRERKQKQKSGLMSNLNLRFQKISFI